MDNDDFDIDEPTFPAGPPKPRVGYKSPPASHRFKPGKSGNPRGRPKGAIDQRKIAEKVLLETHDVVDGQCKVRRTTIELLLLELRNRAFAGSTPAFKYLDKLAAKFDPQPRTKRAGFLVVPSRLTLEAWSELYEAKNDPTQPIPGEDE